MMKIAIVGTSHKMTENEERDVRQLCANIIKGFTQNTMILSGGANGVDSIAIEVARGLGYMTNEYLPEKNEKKYYFKRNAQIANDCDELFCISIPVHDQECYHHVKPMDHQKTAGCWTMKKVLDMGKPAKFFIVGKR